MFNLWHLGHFFKVLVTTILQCSLVVRSMTFVSYRPGFPVTQPLCKSHFLPLENEEKKNTFLTGFLQRLNKNNACKVLSKILDIFKSSIHVSYFYLIITSCIVVSSWTSQVPSPRCDLPIMIIETLHRELSIQVTGCRITIYLYLSLSPSGISRLCFHMCFLRLARLQTPFEVTEGSQNSIPRHLQKLHSF